MFLGLTAFNGLIRLIIENRNYVDNYVIVFDFLVKKL